MESAEGYQYDPSPQRSKPWFDRRMGKITASRLEDWMSVSKAAKTQGKPLKARLDYELELLFEREFGVSYNNYVSDAMEDGRLLEQFAITQYARLTNKSVQEVGCWYSDYFVASPDAAVDDNGLAEAKVLRDNSFSELIAHGFTGSLNKYWKQMQGQLRASGRKWVDFVAINMNTQKVYVVRVTPDQEFFDLIDLYIADDLSVDKDTFKTKKLFGFLDAAPAVKSTNSFNF